MSYCSTKEMAKTWGVSEGLVRRYCREGRIPTAVLEEEGWLIPEGTPKPGTPEAEQKYMIISPIAKRVVYEHGKNNHFGIYEYIQVNLAYSSCRMASNRLTRKQVIELYRTDKLTTSFEPAKIDDLIEIINHFTCVRYAIKTLNFLLRDDFRKYYIPVYLKGKKPIYKQIRTITRVSDFECQCIYIDNPQHLYITDDGIITHNTTLEKFFLSGVIGWWPDCSNLFYSHSGDITRMFYDGELDICTNAAEYTWSEIFRQQVTSTNAKMEQFNVGKYKPFQSVQCTSVGSNNAGKVRVSNKGYLLVDDLIGSIEQALNINILDKLWNSYSVDARQRMLDGAKEIIIATRWSVHDPIGRLQRLYENNNTGKRVRFIAVPDIDPETDESNFNFTVNGLSKEFFESQALFMDEISYKCLYKQKPVEREGLLYREDELRYYTDLPQHEPDAVIGICDTKNTGSDYMVLPVFYKYGEDYYLVDCVCDNSTDFNVLYARMVDLIIEHNVQAIEFESNQGGRAITTTIRNMLAERNFVCNITEKPTETNKEARIIANSYHVKQKILFKEKGLIPAKSDYATLMDQLKSYTQLGKNKHDDVPDCLANFILYTNRKVNRRQSHIAKHIL
mgnify:CR=1 FL=1